MRRIGRIVVFSILSALLVADMVMSLTSCTQPQSAGFADSLNTQLQNANTQVQSAGTQVKQLQADVDVLKAQGEVVPSNLTKSLTDAVNGFNTASAALQQWLTKAQAYQADVKAAATAPNPDAAATGATIKAGADVAGDFAGPYGPLVKLGGALIGGMIAGGLFQKRQTNVANDALSSTVNGIQAALASGQLLASPKAAELVDSAFTVNHPASVTLYDALTKAAAVQPPV